uniref:HEPN domain-containing protein n=1 Tax=Panagrellus redivivus TaxID=6233 RepID=A0A7E4W8M3_PANRE
MALEFVDCVEDFDFNKYLKKVISHQKTGFEAERIYGTTSEGKRYVFVITRILWYACRLIIEPYCYETCRYVKPAESAERAAFYLKDDLDAYIKKKVAQLEGTGKAVESFEFLG